MTIIAFIQNHYPVLNADSSKALSGFSAQVYEKFFEVLVEESGHVIQRAESLDEYQAAEPAEKPHLVVCSPFPEIGNVAGGFDELGRFKATFPETPLVIWTTREEESIRARAVDEFGVVSYYTGTLLQAPDDFADLILDLMRQKKL